MDKKPPIYYQIVVGLLYPVYWFWVFCRQKRLPFYAQEWRARFLGKASKPIANHTAQNGVTGKIIWCHAVSLGELNTAYPLLSSLLQDGHALYITSTTQTGFARAAHVFAQEIKAGSVQHGFMPVDIPWVLRRFLDTVRPDLALFIETELWANALYVLRARGIASVLVNARLKKRSFLRYKKFAALSTSMMHNLSWVVAQDQNSYAHFVQLGLSTNKISTEHSLKWSQSIHAPPDLTLPIQGGAPRLIWIAASTHAGEETLVLQAHQIIRKTIPDALLIVVPRHPERFEAVYTLCQNAFLTARRSSHETITPDTAVYLADTMGELLGLYALSDVAFVGGSLVDGIGGHNPIEPISLSVPIVVGRYTQSCDEIITALSCVGACVQVEGSEELAQAVLVYCAADNAQKAGQAGYTLFLHNQKAYLAQKAYLMPFLT